MRYGWDHSETVRYYELFNEQHARYRDANAALVAAASLACGQRILDIGAGTGRTAELALGACGGRCDVVCVEPAASMRLRGEARLPGVQWLDEPPATGCFDRILCGAAAWQFSPFEPAIGRLFDLLKRGGAFCFNVPSLYLGEPDPPGGGEDPMLTEFVARLAEGSTPLERDAMPLLDVDAIEDILRKKGFLSTRWCMRTKLTQSALRDWLRIPVLTDALLGECSAAERSTLIDAVFAGCDAASWRWETWTGWTAWK